MLDSSQGHKTCIVSDYMFCFLWTNLTFNCLGCHGNQGVNPGDVAVLDMYRRHQA